MPRGAPTNSGITCIRSTATLWPSLTPTIFPTSSKGDALVTAMTGRVVSVRTADCCPILIAAPAGRSVAAVHAGWRGAVAGVIPRTIDKLTALVGVARDQLTAAVGPCIGFDAFEVGLEVLAEFDRVFGNESPVRRNRASKDGKGQVNLADACRLQLIRAGVSPDRIDTTDRCTFRDSEEFFSHRRENGVTGRMSALIAVPKSVLF